MSAVNVFRVAGSETTANSMAWFVYLVLKNPQTLVKLQEELDAAFPKGLHNALDLETLKSLPYFNACLYESMRLKPVVPTIWREVPEDMTLKGTSPTGIVTEYWIPAGTKLNVPIYSIHRSAKKRWIQDSNSNVVEEEAWGVLPDRNISPKHTKPSQFEAVYGEPKLLAKDGGFISFSLGSR
ncbi:hypothetical protein HDU93_006077, partial [Gonapodya sp. JEL0774]